MKLKLTPSIIVPILAAIVGFVAVREAYRYYSIQPKPNEAWKINFNENPYDKMEVTFHIISVEDSYLQYFYTTKELNNSYITSSMSLFMFRCCKPTKIQ